MKDEELFKAWKSEQYKDQTTEERMEFVEHLHIFPKYFEKTFLAGLKAGRPQWHDLRKDPNDLPKEQKEYWCKINYYESEEVFNGCLTYNPKLKGFNLAPDEELFEVTAWCEEPTFDKE